MNRTQSALNTPPPLAARLQGQAQNGLRGVPSQYVTNGLTVSLDLVLIMRAVFEAAGLAAAFTAAVGVLVTSLGQAAARALALSPRSTLKPDRSRPHR